MLVWPPPHPSINWSFTRFWKFHSSQSYDENSIPASHGTQIRIMLPAPNLTNPGMGECCCEDNAHRFWAFFCKAGFESICWICHVFMMTIVFGFRAVHFPPGWLRETCIRQGLFPLWMVGAGNSPCLCLCCLWKGSGGPVWPAEPWIGPRDCGAVRKPWPCARLNPPRVPPRCVRQVAIFCNWMLLLESIPRYAKTNCKLQS